MFQKRKKLHGIMLDHDFNGNERCFSCDASCCRGFPSIRLAPEEYQMLENLGARRLVYTLKEEYFLIIENGCEFLENNRCSIFETRPEVCRRFVCSSKGTE